MPSAANTNNAQIADEANAGQQPIKTDPTREYVWGGSYGWSNQMYRYLPQGLDDLERDFPEIYDKMLLDAKVQASVSTLKLSTLGQGVKLTSRKQDETDPEYDLAQEIVEFCQRNLDRLTTPLPNLLYELMDGMVFGHSIAEQVYEYPQTGPDKGKLCLKSIKVKPRRFLAFVVDEFYNVKGLTTTRQNYTVEDPTNPMLGNLLARERFVIFAPFTRESDPRGKSILRSAYPAWWMKTQSWPEHIRYLAQFASPMLVGYTPEKARPFTGQVNAQGVPLTAEDAMVNSLISARNGAVMSFPFGTKVEAISVGNGGQAFMESSRMFDEQISMAILLQTLATGEGIHQSRAASQTHKDVLNMLIGWLADTVAGVVEFDILRWLIAYNYSEELADRLRPKASLRSTATEDLPSTAAAVAGLWSAGYLDESQVSGTDALLGLDKRTNPPVHLGNAGAGKEAATGIDGGEPGMSDPQEQPTDQNNDQSQDYTQPATLLSTPVNSTSA